MTKRSVKLAGPNQMVEWSRIEIAIYGPRLDVDVVGRRRIEFERVSAEVNRVAGEILLRLKSKRLVREPDVFVEASSVQKFVQALLQGEVDDA